MSNQVAEQWAELCARYLHEVERALGRSGHPRRQEVLDDLKHHLAQRYADLGPEERTPEKLREIIDQMGTPEEHAEILLGEREPQASLSCIWRNRYCRRWGIAILGAALIVFGLFWPSLGLPVLSGTMYLALIAALVVRYIHTRDVGFLWLGLAIVVWPLVAGLASRFGVRPIIDRIAAGEKVGVYPFTLVESGRLTLGSLMMIFAYLQTIIRQGLLLMAVVKIGLSWDSGASRT